MISKLQGKKILLQLNELEELRNEAYEKCQDLQGKDMIREFWGKS